MIYEGYLSMQFERNYKLVNGKFWQYFFPTIFSVFVGNMAVVLDSMIVSSLVGVESLSGLQIMVPVTCLINLFALMIGFGGSLICAAAKANFNEKEANIIYSVSIISIVFIGILLTMFGLLFPDIIIRCLSGSTQPNLYALEYFKMFIFGVPFFCYASCMFHFVRSEGMTKFTFKALLVASILNPLLDIIFIYYFYMGIAGSGLATAISYIGWSIYISGYFFKSEKTLKIIKVNLASSLRYFLNICKSSFAGASNQLYLTISMLCYNVVIITWMGDAGLLSQQICTNTLFVISIFTIGLTQTTSPIISVYYQDEDYSSVDYIKSMAFKYLMIVGLVFAGILIFFPNIIMTIFFVDIKYQGIVTNALRLYGLSYLTLGFVVFYIFYTQSIQKNKLANIASLFCNLILIVVMLMILPAIFGANGIWITPFCVGVISLISMIIYSKYLNNKSNGEYHGIYINKSHGENFWEFTINGNVDEINGLISLIKNKLGINKLSNYVCLSLEEFFTHIIETNDGLDTIDVLLGAAEDSIKIHIKDEGVDRSNDFLFKNNDINFNRKVDYTRVLGLNSTLITIENR